LGNIKWFVGKKVKTFYRLNGDGGAKFNKKKGKIDSGDLSHSYDPQTGLCIGSELEGKYIASLGAKSVTVDAGSKSSFMTYVDDAADNGNTMVHCTLGADRTGFTVALVLQKIKKPLPPERGGSTSAGSYASGEDLYAYTVSFNSWDSHAICGSSGCSNLGYMKYLSHFYPPADFCARKERMTKCKGCTCAKNITDYGITGIPVTPDPPAPELTEREKCNQAEGWSWWTEGESDEGYVYEGCYEDP
jgi:hypothetical protein